MSDIDFDELDRAVNGALGTNDTPAPSTLPVEDTPSVDEAPTISHIERTQLSPVSPSTRNSPMASTAPAARRSSGRFMDMVHPSSDMRSQARSTTVTAQPEKTPEFKQTEGVSEYSETPAWNEPLESPFLPDAKVNKRPLGGGAAPANPTSITDSFDFQGLLDEPQEELLQAPEPQELLEATSLPDPIDFAAATAVSDEIESKSFETEESSDKQPEVEEISPQPVVPASPLIDEEPTGPTSITPQYKEQPSSVQESGAMYDTESYHQAVVAPVKKKSGWFTVLWIVLLVLFGAGAGWAVYTYVLPML